MKCTNCGAEFAVGKFCPSCGTPAPVADNTQNSLGVNPAPQPVQSVAPQPVQPVAPQPVKPVMPKPAYTAVAAPAKGKKPIKLVVAIIALVLVAALVIGALTVIKSGPLNKIVSATKNTLDCGSFTAELTVEQYGESVDMLILVEFEPEEEILNVYMEAENGYGDEITMGIYDGYVFSVESYGDDKYYYREDISDELGDVFESYLEYSDPIDHVFDDFRVGSDWDDLLFLLEELDDATDGSLSDIFDLDLLTDCLTEYMKQMNDEDWMEEYAGCTIEKDGGTVYTFEPDLYDFFDESLPYFETAFEDEDVYEDLVDTLPDAKSDLKEVDMTLEFTVDSDELTAINVEVMEMTFEISIYDHGKTEIDVEEMEDIMEKCEENE